MLSISVSREAAFFRIQSLSLSCIIGTAKFISVYIRHAIRFRGKRATPLAGIAASETIGSRSRNFSRALRRALSEFAGHSFVNRGQLNVEELRSERAREFPDDLAVWLRSILLGRRGTCGREKNTPADDGSPGCIVAGYRYLQRGSVIPLSPFTFPGIYFHTQALARVRARFR